jgi:hypothetical protein
MSQYDRAGTASCGQRSCASLVVSSGSGSETRIQGFSTAMSPHQATQAISPDGRDSDDDSDRLGWNGILRGHTLATFHYSPLNTVLNTLLTARLTADSRSESPGNGRGPGSEGWKGDSESVGGPARQ